MNYLVCLVVLCGVLSVNSAPQSQGAKNSQYVQCRSDADCPDDSCCAINNGAGQGQTTMCSKRLQLNVQCRPPSDMAKNITIITPDDQMVPVYAHEYLCPCIHNLICVPEKGVCMRSLREN